MKYTQVDKIHPNWITYTLKSKDKSGDWPRPVPWSGRWRLVLQHFLSLVPPSLGAFLSSGRCFCTRLLFLLFTIYYIPYMFPIINQTILSVGVLAHWRAWACSSEAGSLQVWRTAGMRAWIGLVWLLDGSWLWLYEEMMRKKIGRMIPHARAIESSADDGKISPALGVVLGMCT